MGTWQNLETYPRSDSGPRRDTQKNESISSNGLVYLITQCSEKLMVRDLVNLSPLNKDFLKPTNSPALTQSYLLQCTTQSMNYLTSTH